MLMPGERSVFAINAELESALAQNRRALWTKSPNPDALRKVREAVRVRPLAELPEPKQRDAGVVEREGYRIEKLVLEPEPGIQLPALAFMPAQPGGDAFLYLHGQGKQTDAAVCGPIERLVTRGHFVLAVDLRGMGETENRARKWSASTFGPAAGEFFLAYLLGKSLAGIWTEDVLTCARFVARSGQQGTSRKVHLIGIGQAGLPALHAAALEPDVFTSVTLQDALSSWAEVVRTPSAARHLTGVVHGALRTYDLPDLAASIGAGKLAGKVEALNR